MIRKTRINTVDAERDLLAIAEKEFTAAGVADAPARAKLVCERYRFRARRQWKRSANLRQAAADIVRFQTEPFTC